MVCNVVFKIHIFTPGYISRYTRNLKKYIKNPHSLFSSNKTPINWQFSFPPFHSKNNIDDNSQGTVIIFALQMCSAAISSFCYTRTNSLCVTKSLRSIWEPRKYTLKCRLSPPIPATNGECSWWQKTIYQCHQRQRNTLLSSLSLHV